MSIVIPTRNEAADIAATLDHCLALDYDRKEIIVVDDSADETPAIVGAYADRGVRLIHRDMNSNGCCGARNLGMQQANGEIVVLLNADDRPGADFLRCILPHYQDGADYLVVHSVAENIDSIWGKYAHAIANKYLSGRPDMEWSEGFSCRRLVAEKAGYIPGDFPVPFCRDFMLGEAIARVGGVKHTDLAISMEHIVPDSLYSYWRNQVWRGTFAAPYAYYLMHVPRGVVWVREILKLGRTMFKYGLIVPGVWQAVRLVRHAPNGWRDGLAMWWVGLVQEVALRVGNLKGLKTLTQMVAE